MTTSALLLLILAVLLAQVAVFSGLALRRYRSTHAAGDHEAIALTPGASESRNDWREFRVSQRHQEDNDQTQCSFELVPVDGQPLRSFKPGQFLSFVFPSAGAQPGQGASPTTITRCYSLSDQPRDSHYRITVKRVAAPDARPELPPGVASNYLHDQVKVGDILKARAPSGRFFLDANANADDEVGTVFIAGGIGITPMMSMLNWSVATQPTRKIHLYYGLRHGGVNAFGTALRQLAAAAPQITVSLVFSAARTVDVLGRDYDFVGHVDIDLLKRTLPHGRHAFYVCGPPAMMQSLMPALLAWGVSASDIHTEAFGPASIAPLPSKPAMATPEAAFDVQFKRSGRTLAWTGSDASLLDFAERQGIAIEAGCRVGSCGTCETRVLSGEVDYPQAPDFPVRDGYALVCLGKPRAALVLDA